MTRAAVAGIEPVGIAGETVRHPLRSVRPGRAEKQMDMVGHTDEAEYLEAEFVDRRLEPFDQTAVVPLVAEYLLPPIATRYGMVNRTRELNSQWTSHSGGLSQHCFHGNTRNGKHEKRA